MRLKPALEAVQFQRGSPLFVALTEIFRGLMEAPITQAALEKSLFSKVVRDFLGLRVLPVTETQPSGFISPMVSMPDMKADHPMWTMDQSLVVKGADSLTRIVKAKDGVLNGTVDRVKSRVGGVFSDFLIPVIFPYRCFSIGFTAEEFAALTLHELGHPFTFFENIAETCRRNFVLASLTSGWLNTDSVELRFRLIRATEATLGVDVDSKMDLATNATPDAALNVVVNRLSTQDLRSTTGYPRFDVRTTEALADQFAVRHGAGLAVAQALDRFGAKVGLSEYKTTAQHITVQAIRYASTLVPLPILFGVFLGPAGIALGAVYGAAITLIGASFLLTAQLEREHDAPKVRAQRIRQDMVVQLKDLRLVQATRDVVLNDIDTLTTMIESLQEHSTLEEFVYKLFSSKYRKELASEQQQLLLETLANNELFIQAAKLQRLKGQLK